MASVDPTQNLLLQNYPNPFNPETWIPYQLSEDSPVSISIYDTTGKLVRTLSLGFQSAGFYNSQEHAARIGMDAMSLANALPVDSISTS